MEVVWTDLAVESLSDILSYVQGFFGKRIAKSTSDKIVSFVSTLGTSPYIGRRLATLSSYGEVRCAYYKQNHIYYRIKEQRIEIIIVWDGRQDPLRLRSMLLDFLTRYN